MRQLLKEIIKLSQTYQKAYKRPLGITGEVGEALLCEKFRLTRAAHQTKGYDAVTKKRKTVQIKSRVTMMRSQRTGTFAKHRCDYILLALFSEKFDLLEHYVVKKSVVEKKIKKLYEARLEKNKKASMRRSLSISQFKSLATKYQVGKWN